MTARTSEKGDGIIKSFEPKLQTHVSYEIVPDVSKDGAFDHVRPKLFRHSPIRLIDARQKQVFQSDHKFDYVIHTASPYSFKVDDPVKDFLDPAIKGTTGILKSIKAYAPSVKRVVITSSSAAILNPWKHEQVYDESKWAPYTWDDALKPQNAYAASKARILFNLTLLHTYMEEEEQ